MAKNGGAYNEIYRDTFSDNELHSVERVVEFHSQLQDLPEAHCKYIRITQPHWIHVLLDLGFP